MPHAGALSKIAWRLGQQRRTPSLTPLTKAPYFFSFNYLAAEIICFLTFLSLCFLRAIF
jgi:hypothetical protein